MTTEAPQEPKRKSAVLELLDLVYGNANKATAHSWERLNHSMRDALSLAIGSGMEFAVGDVGHVLTHYRSGYWVSDSDEWIYAAAIAVGNASAFESYETCKGRAPIIADDVTLNARSGSGYTHGNPGRRQRERLAVGAEFPWKGHTVTVTSFAADSSYANACSYKPQKKGEYGTKIDKRFKISREDIITERAESKRRAELQEKLLAVGTANKSTQKIVAALGVKTMDDYMRLPLKKIEAVVKQFAGACP